MKPFLHVSQIFSLENGSVNNWHKYTNPNMQQQQKINNNLQQDTTGNWKRKEDILQ